MFKKVTSSNWLQTTERGIKLMVFMYLWRHVSNLNPKYSTYEMNQSWTRDAHLTIRRPSERQPFKAHDWCWRLWNEQHIVALEVQNLPSVNVTGSVQTGPAAPCCGWLTRTWVQPAGLPELEQSQNPFFFFFTGFDLSCLAVGDIFVHLFVITDFTVERKTVSC